MKRDVIPLINGVPSPGICIQFWSPYLKRDRAEIVGIQRQTMLIIRSL